MACLPGNVTANCTLPCHQFWCLSTPSPKPARHCWQRGIPHVCPIRPFSLRPPTVLLLPFTRTHSFSVRLVLLKWDGALSACSTCGHCTCSSFPRSSYIHPRLRQLPLTAMPAQQKPSQSCAWIQEQLPFTNLSRNALPPPRGRPPCLPGP